jgi:GrpB-like predicted nucleotidyltransferase (UPF0157 family)
MHPRTRVDGSIRLADPSPQSPALFATQERRIRQALGARALTIEHVGSTAVADLAAKPDIDIVLAVADPTDEPAYVPALEAAGYTLRVREPDWHEHRMLRRDDPAVHLHVFAAGSAEIDRMLRFRDRPRDDAAARAAYEGTKRALGARHWKHLQDYADAKNEIVARILSG